jgi:RimJ/RimL family protein N-acetyltransferase
MILTTARLVLRPWQDADRPLVAALTGDAEVMRFFTRLRTGADSDAWVDRMQAHIDRHGFGIWAVEAPGVAPLIGFVGLVHVPAEIPVCPVSGRGPAVEIAWTLGRAHWRRGYATEAARAAIGDGFIRVGLSEIVAFTAAVNLPSRGVMQGLGMRHDPSADFDHPRIESGHPLRRHVVYRTGRISSATASAAAPGPRPDRR